MDRKTANALFDVVSHNELVLHLLNGHFLDGPATLTSPEPDNPEGEILLSSEVYSDLSLDEIPLGSLSVRVNIQASELAECLENTMNGNIPTITVKSIY